MRARKCSASGGASRRRHRTQHAKQRRTNSLEPAGTNVEVVVGTVQVGAVKKPNHFACEGS
eukprot:2797164-Alexandrium_andersonii.AAC.1